jgi:hypothetical protein
VRLLGLEDVCLLDVELFIFVEIDRWFTGAYCLYHQGDDGGNKTLEMSANLYETSQRNLLEDSHFNTRSH